MPIQREKCYYLVCRKWNQPKDILQMGTYLSGRSRQTLRIDPNILGPNRVMGFKGMLKHEVLAGKGFRDLNTCKEYYAKNMTAAQRIAYLEQQLEYKDQEIEFLKKIVSLHQGGKG